MAIPLGSGLAAFGAGVGPCGHDPEEDPSEKVVQTPVSALYFDPYDRVYAQEADFTMREGAGPIQRAALLMLPKGALSSVASSGLDLDVIRRASSDRRLRVISDQLRVTWKVLLETKQISMGAVTLEPGEPWSGRFYVEVQDLVTPKAKPSRLAGKAA